MQGVLGCALQNTYTFSAKGPSAVRLQPAEKKPRKFLFTISNTGKGFELTHNSIPPVLHWFTALKKKNLSSWGIRRPYLFYKNDVKMFWLHLGITFPHLGENMSVYFGIKYKNEGKIMTNLAQLWEIG